MRSSAKNIELDYFHVNDSQITIRFSPDLRKDILSNRQLRLLSLDKPPALLNILYPPYLLELTKNEYILIARHWAFSLCLESKLDNIAFLIVKDKSIIPVILNHEKLEANLISQINKFVKKTSRATIARRKAIESGRVCPLCRSALVYSRQNQKADGKGLFAIRCFNFSQHRCNFRANLTEYEYQRFLGYNFATSEWLTPLSDRKCPKCKSNLFVRTHHKSNIDKAKFEVCMNYIISESPSCTYARRINT